MQAQPLIQHLRFRLQLEMIASQDCDVLAKTERILGLYEDMVVRLGVADKEIGPQVNEAFDALFAAAREHNQRLEADPPKSNPAKAI